MNEPLFDFPSAPVSPGSLDLSRGHVVMLDGNNLAMRSFHAAKHRLSAYDPLKGETQETGSLHLFCIGLARYLKDLQPSHFVVCWDGGRSVHRERLYADYKLARHAGHEGEPPHGPAFKLITEFLDLTGIEQWHQDGVEADDLIAAGYRITREENPVVPITIMSSDKDLLQLLDAHTRQFRFSSYGTPSDIWTDQKVKTELGITPAQVPYYMALTGDPGDGVPGAKGIGPKKALKLLETHDWNLPLIASLRQDGKMIMLSYQLVDLLGELCCRVDPVPEFRPLTVTSPYAQQRLERLTEFCARYQLRELWRRVVDSDLW